MKRSGTLSRVVGTRSGIPWCTQARVLVGPGDPGAPQPVATGRHWPRSTIFRVLVWDPYASGGQKGVMEVLAGLLTASVCGHADNTGALEYPAYEQSWSFTSTNAAQICP